MIGCRFAVAGRFQNAHQQETGEGRHDQGRPRNMILPEDHLNKRQPIDQLGQRLAERIELAGGEQHDGKAGDGQGIVRQQIRHGANRAGKEKPAVPLLAYFAIPFRYGVMVLAVYVIFIYLRVPLVSMVVGLCALGAATVLASVYEILHPAD